MNFIAIIGVIDKIIKEDKEHYATVKIKVEKPFIENQHDDWFELVETRMDKRLFKQEMRLMAEGSIIGIKGRLQCSPLGTQTIAERVQLF